MITDYVVPLSGGLDSTYLLYNLLKENDPKNIHVFHLSIIHNAENRWQQELTASKNIYRWLTKEFGNFRIKYVTLDMKSIPLGFDTDQVFLIGQKMCYGLLRKSQRIVMCHGVVADDADRPFIQKRMNFKGQGINHLLWNALIDSMTFKVNMHSHTKIDRKVYCPLLKIYKSEIIQNIPEDLLSMVWVCRKNVDGKQCGECGSCKLHEKSIKDAFK